MHLITVVLQTIAATGNRSRHDSYRSFSDAVRRVANGEVDSAAAGSTAGTFLNEAAAKETIGRPCAMLQACPDAKESIRRSTYYVVDVHVMQRVDVDDSDTGFTMLTCGCRSKEANSRVVAAWPQTGPHGVASRTRVETASSPAANAVPDICPL